MNDFSALSQRIEHALDLATRPVAVTFVHALPAGVELPSTPVPAGCSFWEIGTKKVVATSARHHEFCAIGVHTHKLSDAPSSQQHELETALAAMQGLDYVRPNEVEALPVMTSSSNYVVYAP